jgi:gingipain R
MKSFLVSAFILLVSFSFSREGIKIIQSNDKSITLEVSFSEVKKQSVDINGTTYYKLYSTNCVPVLEKGYPQVLRDAISIALPEAVNPKLEILSSEFIEVNNMALAPSKGSLTRDINPATIPYTFSEAYSKNEFYPSQLTEVSSLYNLRQQNGASISFYPVQTNPVTNTLKVYSKLIVKITYLNQRGKAIALNEARFYSNEEKKIMSQRFINYNTASKNSKILYTPINEMGSMLVISAPQFLNSVLPLVEWKNQKGISTQLVSTALTGTTQASIKNYIQSYYTSNPSLVYVLLVGDHEQVPSYNAGIAGSEIKWSDIKYGMILGNDWYPELMVGRFSGSMSAEITTMVNRTLEYEKNPTLGNWWGKAIGIGSNQGYGYGDDGEADWQHMRNMGTKLIAGSSYNQFHEFYDSSHGGNDAPGDPTSAMVISAVNMGSGLFLYSGHGSQNSCATSNYDITDINASTNYGKYPFSLQVACNNGTFIGGTCFSEAFVRATGNNSLGSKGAIASCGSSILMAWAEPMQVQDEIVDIISNQYPNLKCYSLGALFYNGGMSMMDKYPTSGKNTMETWVMFGDPSCLFRSAVPAPIIATHANCIPSTASNFVVNTASGPLVYASLSQNNLPLGSSLVSNNVANITVSPNFNPSQNIDLTITGYNTIPYVQSIPVCLTTNLQISHPVGSFIKIESLFDEKLTIDFNAIDIQNISIQVYNLQGKEVKTVIPTSAIQTIDMSECASSVYLVKIISGKELIRVAKTVKR